MNWKPIETAPEGGVRFIAYRAGYEESMAIVFRSKHFGPFIAGAPFTTFHGATHWAPIPQPPS